MGSDWRLAGVRDPAAQQGSLAGVPGWSCIVEWCDRANSFRLVERVKRICKRGGGKSAWHWKSILEWYDRWGPLGSILIRWPPISWDPNRANAQGWSRRWARRPS